MFNVQMKNCLNSWLAVKKKKKKKKTLCLPLIHIKTASPGKFFCSYYAEWPKSPIHPTELYSHINCRDSSKNNFPSYFSPDHEQQTTNFNPTNNSRTSSYLYLTLPIQNQYDSNFTSRPQNNMLPIKLAS